LLEWLMKRRDTATLAGRTLPKQNKTARHSPAIANAIIVDWRGLFDLPSFKHAGWTEPPRSWQRREGLFYGFQDAAVVQNDAAGFIRVGVGGRLAAEVLA